MNPEATDSLIQQVAALYCERMDVDEIAKVLSLSEDTARAIVEQAERKDYIRYVPELNIPILEPDAARLVQFHLHTDMLRKALEKPLEGSLVEFHITPSPEEMFAKYASVVIEGSEEWTAYRRAEYRSLNNASLGAAEALTKCLLDDEGHVVGVNWGVAVSSVIQNFRPRLSMIGDARSSNEASIARIFFISLFGDLDFYTDDPSAKKLREFNCNSLVTRFAQRLGERAEAVPLNVPGFIPAQFASDDKNFDTIRRFLGRHRSYRRIFGDLPDGNDPVQPRKYNGITDVDTEPDVLLTKMDTIVTGFGSGDSYTSFTQFVKLWLDETEFAALQQYCAKGDVVGDIGGHLIPSRPAEQDDELQVFLRKVNRRLVSTQPSDFVDVAYRHRQRGKGAGVVGVAVGARKAKVLARLLSRSPCPISRLFLDTHCALALLWQLGPEELRQYMRTPEARVLKPETWSRGTRELIPT